MVVNVEDEAEVQATLPSGEWLCLKPNTGGNYPYINSGVFCVALLITLCKFFKGVHAGTSKSGCKHQILTFQLFIDVSSHNVTFLDGSTAQTINYEEDIDSLIYFKQDKIHLVKGNTNHVRTYEQRSYRC